MDWNDFATRLTIELMRLPVHSFLIVQAPGGLPYTQAMRSGDRTDAEAVGSAFLPRALSSRQERRLDALGWQRPDGRDHLNWWNRITMTDRAGNPAPGHAESCAELAGRMVGAFRDVYGVNSPLELVYQASRNGAGGGPLALPGLGIPVAIPDAQDEPVRSSRRSAKPVSLETALASARERGDQDEYLNLLARATLCLPSPLDPATVPEADHQYATARFGDGTFVLAFTSPEAMDRSLRGQAVHHRQTTLTRLARDWPHPQWQLAINPGLPSAAYLDAQSLLHPTEDEPQPAAQPEPRTANGRLTPTDVSPASVAPPADVSPPIAEPVAAAPTVATPYPSVQTASPSVDVASPTAETASTFDASSPSSEPPADVAPPSIPRDPVSTQPDHEPLPLPDTAPESQAPVPPKLDTWSDDTDTTASTSPSGEESYTAFDTSPGFHTSPELNQPPATEPEATPAFNTTPEPPAAPGFSQPPSPEPEATPAFNAAPEPLAAFANPTPEQPKADSTFDAATEPATAGPMSASGEESYTAFDTSSGFDHPQATPAFDAVPEPPAALATPASLPVPDQPEATPAFDAAPGFGTPQVVAGEADDVPEAIPAFDTSAGNGVAGEPYLGVEAVVMQKVVRAEHVPHYLEGGYDRVAGYVHRLRDVQELNTPARLVRGLGLVYQDSPFSPGDDTIHVIRWAAVKPGLFRKPLGGIDEWSMGIIPGGWVIEKAPFPGSGYAPGDGTAVPEFKIDSQRLPHGAELYVLDRAGGETLVAGFDADRRRWVPRPIVEVPVRQPSAEHTGGRP